MKVYITKYALSKGIKEYKAKRTEFSTMIEIEDNKDLFGNLYHKPDWHLRKKEAIERAEQMRISEINKLLKRIKKLYTLKFE